ncbi:alpha/beta fold hydrolase [Streptosporangium lutulentum]
MHYVTAGQGEPLLLLHGTPKNHFYWYKLIPLLTEHFTVIAPDLRGFGHSDKPPAEAYYDSLTSTTDLAELMGQLGHASFHVHGEDRGAEYGYVSQPCVFSESRDRQGRDGRRRRPGCRSTPRSGRRSPCPRRCRARRARRRLRRRPGRERS